MSIPGFQKKDIAALYNRYRVSIRMRDRLCGGIPQGDDLLAEHIKRKTGYADAQTDEQIAAATLDLVNREVHEGTNGFLADADRGLYIWAFQVKAMLKQSASILGITKQKRGTKQILHEGAEVKGIEDEDRLFVGRTEPDGYATGPVHAMTPSGPITAIKRTAYVERVTLVFEVWVLKTAPQESRHIGEDELRQMLLFSCENGLGAERSQGEGKFDVLEFSRIADDMPIAPKRAPKAEKAVSPE